MRRFPDRYEQGQLRTLQRRFRDWRAQQGPGKEVYFPQVHPAGRTASIDFTRMNELGVTIAGERLEDDDVGTGARRRWRANDSRVSATTIDDHGCVTLARRGGRMPARATRPGRVTGQDPRLRDLYDALGVVFAGAWSPTENGGFERSARCAP